jgi:hypothetical protein
MVIIQDLTSVESIAKYTLCTVALGTSALKTLDIKF